MKLRNAKREQAARLLSEDRLTDEQISQNLGITRRTLARWKLDKAFMARVDEHTRMWEERATKHHLAKRERRVEVLQDIHDRILAVIGERSQDPAMQGVPGGRTGLVCKTLKGIGKGQDFRVVEVFEVDTGTLKELRAFQEQISKELGQHVERSAVDVTIGLAAVVSEARQRVMQGYLPAKSEESGEVVN